MFDVLLYDYAERYFAVDREKTKVTPETFKMVAKAIESSNTAPLRFINWYNKQEGLLGKNHLWYMRRISVHKGLPESKTFVENSQAFLSIPVSGVSAGTVPPRRVSSSGSSITVKRGVDRPRDLYIGDFTPEEWLQLCGEAFVSMKKVVEEAKRRFG